MADIFKRTLVKREKDAGLSDDTPVDDGKAGRDAGNLPGPFQMSQSKFSGYPDGSKRKGPPSDMLKKHDKE